MKREIFKSFLYDLFFITITTKIVYYFEFAYKKTTYLKATSVNNSYAHIFPNIRKYNIKRNKINYFDYNFFIVNSFFYSIVA